MSKPVVDPSVKVAPDFLSYNLLGYHQVGAIYELTIQQYRDAVMELASRKIDDITDVIVTPELERGVVRTRLWFPSTSKHVSMSLRNTALPTNRLHNYSDEFVKFAKTFGYRKFDDDPVNKNENFVVNLKQVIDWNMSSQAGSGKDVCITVANYIFVSMLFDLKGVAYKKEFPKATYPNARTEPIEITHEWVYTHDGRGHRNNLVAIRINKSLENRTRGTGEPRASRAGKL